MTTKICQNCFDKINEIVQYRELCAATNIELRMALGLPIENDETSADEGDHFKPEVVYTGVRTSDENSSSNGASNRASNTNVDAVSSDTNA